MAKVKIYQERGWYQEPLEAFEECIARYQRIDDDYKNNKDLREAELRIEFRKGYREIPKSFSERGSASVEKRMEIEFKK
ncbi:hypothetical protein A6V39_03645 [Candidatus Mycoplasma haematobovis]|uniref:Uncharacterized protein n=1 Tax=Candidatus Mycoplasma haematobovis TaxID=432608 RepID=A0A1A9QE63_9MOLU|nr:hypothetical protein [Candidatus Mycoplasma haematobovis]OAL09980.1 hypothetical protein A6V39_03645 [Candidatus Mycoplasma haematobovis]